MAPHAFQPLLHPQLFGGIDECIFSADAAAIRVFERRDDVAQRFSSAP
jgi:hypothetical protein